MPLVEIPDKQMTVEFPDTMTAQEIEGVILSDIYGQKKAAPSIKEPPMDSGFSPRIPSYDEMVDAHAQSQNLEPPISTITNKPIPTAEEKFRQSDFITSAPATAAGITASIPTGIAAGYVGLLRLATTGDLDKTKAMMDEINAQPGKFIKTPEQQRVVENISQALMYFPEKGKEVMGKIADAELQRLSPEDQKRLGAIKPIMETAGEFGVLAAFPLLKKAVGNSTWYRMLSNQERGLVIQSLDDVLRNNPNMTEGEILRKWDNPNFKREALARRMKTEQETPLPEAESTPQAISKPTGLPISDLQKAIAKQAISETLAQNGLTPETFLQIANRTESLARKPSLETLPSEASAESSETSGQVPVEVKPVAGEVKPTPKAKGKEPWEMSVEELADKGNGEDNWYTGKQHLIPRDKFKEIGITRTFAKKDDGLHYVLGSGELGPKVEPEILERSRNQSTESHRYYVEKALKEGKPVPESVLKDYPDLKPEAKGKDAEKVYHGGAGVDQLTKVFSILTPEEKMKIPSSNVGLTGLSMTTDKSVALEYSRNIGQTEKIYEAKINPKAKIYEVDTNGDGIDDFLTDNEINDIKAKGFDAIRDISTEGEKEFRALTDKAIAAPTATSVPKPTSPDAPTIENEGKTGAGKTTPKKNKPKEPEPSPVDEETLKTLSRMATDFAGTTGKNRGTQGGDIAHDIGSSNPEWFQNLNARIRKNKTTDVKGISRDSFNAVLNNIRNGKKLTINQVETLEFMKSAIPDYLKTSGEDRLDSDINFMEKEGYEILGGEKIVAGDLNKGDKVYMNSDEYEVKGEKDGEVLLEDGIPVKVDPFDTIQVDGIKKAEGKEIVSYRGQTGIPFDKNIETTHMGGLVFSAETPEIAGKYAQGQNPSITELKASPKKMLDLGDKILDGSQDVNVEIRKALNEPDGPGYEILSLLRKHGYDAVTFKERAGWDATHGRTYAYAPEVLRDYPDIVKSNTETLPDGSTVNWDKEKVIEKDGLKGTYYPTYKKDGSFKSWHTKTEIERLKSLKGTEGLNLKQDNYGKQTEIKGKTTGKQAGLGLVVEDKNQPGMFSKSRKSYGDSSIKSESSIRRPPAEKKPDINRETPKDIKPIAAMKMPELLQIYKEITGGKYPKIKEILGRLAERQGVFRHKGTDSDIYLKADIFANEQEALETLAHEMGHWIDYIPDKSMSRGNILGRIASLKHYADHWLDDILGGKGRLTDADKKYFKNEAKKLAGGEKWIDEVIEKTLPITPDDILDIWNSGMPREALHPELLDYIQRLSSAEKKAIVVAAMKGIVPEDVKKFAYIAKEHTGKKIKVKIKASDQEVMDKYSELIANELKKRNIYNLNEIREELKAFTNEWRPFDPAADSQYTKYRYSGKELYADAMSGLLSDPDRLRVIAPKFWSAWFTWIHRKPEFKAVWNAWQDKIGQGAVEVTKERMANIYDMFEKNDKARIDALMKEREGSMVSAYDGLMTYFWDKNHKALGLLSSLEKEGGLRGSHAESTRYLIEESNYIASEISVYVGDVYEHIMNPLESMGYDAKELGLVLFQKRVLGDRSKIGNPLGHSPETTGVDIKNIEASIWGKEKSDALNAFADKLRTLRESFIFPILEEAGLATPDFMKIIRDTKSYATFSNIEWFKNKYGNGPGAGFYRQIGTLGEIENPLVSMILKDISLIRAARMNIAKRELSIDLFHSGALEPAKMRWSKDINGKVPVEPTDSKKALYSFLNQGKAEYYYASKKIVDMFKYAPVEAQQVATIWRYIAQPMRELLVSKNPIWMVRNVFRDVRQTMKNIPEVTLRDIPKLLIEYKKAFAETVKDVYGKERSLDIRDMMNDKALPINRIWTAFDETIESELDRIATELNFSRKQNLDAPTALKAIRFVWDNLDKIGRISEVWGKLAGYKYLKKYSDRDQKQISHVVRSRVGTPDYRRVGTGQQLTNNIFMFSNVGKEGIRAAIESAVEDPGGYAWKTLWLNIMPKLIMAGAGSGALIWVMSKMGIDTDDENDMKKVKTLQRVIEGISEYDRANYTIVPLGITDKGKSAYLRIPEDYEGQFWGALAHKLMTGRLTGHEGVSNLVLEQQPYKFHPYAIAINRLITYYIKGQNPVEEYSGRNIMTDATHTVGGWTATKAMGKSTWKELGLSLVYEPAWDGLERSETAYEKTLKTFPLNSLGTFLRFSDQGITEKIEKELKTIRKEKALETIAFNEAFIKLTNGETLAGDEVLAILSKPAHQQKEKLLSLIGRKYGDAYLRQLTRPNLSKDEKAIIFSMMLKDRRTQEKKP